MAATPGPMNVITTRRLLAVTAIPKTVKQAAADPNNEWGVDRILVLNTETPSNPPTAEQTAAMVRLDEFIGITYMGGLKPPA